MQDDKITFHKDSIDVCAESTSKLIMYDTVVQDFQSVANKALQMGAYLIDKNIEKRTQKGNFNLILDDLDREFLLVQVLDYEANFQFSKAKYIWNLVDILMNTFRFKSSADLMRHIQELIPKRPQVSLFEDSLDLSYQQETKYLEKLASIAGDILTFQKSQENKFDEFQAEIFSKEEICDLMSIYQEAQKGSSPVSSTHLINLGELEDRNFDAGFFRGQGQDQIYINTQVVEKEFCEMKPYEFLEKAFYILLEIEQTVYKSVDYLHSSNSDLEKIFDLRNTLLNEAHEIWEKIKYNIPILSSIKEYDSLEYDILLDMPNSFYGIMKDQKMLSFKQIVSSSQFGSFKNKNPEDMKKLEQQQPQFRFIPEENYFQNLIEFIRLKETIMTCLLSSAYQAQIYQHQIVLFGREDIYQGLLEKSGGGDFEKNFFNFLLNLENVQLDFNLKELDDSRLIIPNANKLSELWKISEYLLLHEALIQNALQINYSYTLDLRKTFFLEKKRDSAFYKAIQSKHSQALFFNVIEKKRVWLNQYKSSFFITGKQTAAAASVNSAEKNERVLEFNSNIRHYLYYDALRIQTIEMTRLLKDMILKAGLNQTLVFNIREAFTEENPKKYQVQISDIFADSGENTPLENKTKHGKILEDYIGEGGKWIDPFVIPAVQDIIYMEISPTEKGSLLGEREKNDHEGVQQNNKLLLAQKILQVFEDEVMTNKKNKKKAKTNENSSQLFSRLKETAMMNILEWCHYLFQILMYELFETTIQWSKTDVLMMYEEGCRDQELYRRNQLKIEQGLYQTTEWWKKTKNYILKVKKGLKVGVPKDVAFKTMKKILKEKSRKVTLSVIQLAFDLRKQGDTESLKLLRRFLIKTSFNTLNYLYVFNESFCFHNYYKNQKIIKDQLLQDISLQDSETMKLLDFIFIGPLLKRKQDKNSLFIDFISDYEESAKSILFDLYTLPRNVKALLHSRILNTDLTLENLITSKDVLIHENLHEYVKSSNKILKKNLSNNIMEEALLAFRQNIRPFTSTSFEIIADFEKNIQYHYSRGLGRENSAPLPDSKDLEVDLTKSVVLKNILKTQIEKIILTEGIDFYQRNISLLRAQRDKGGNGSLKDIPVETDIKRKVLEGLEHQRFLPFFQGYAHKVMNKSLFIEAHNIGQCIVIPIKDFEQDINELNNEVLQYFGELQYDIQRRYNGRMSIVKNQFRDLTKELERVKYSLDHMRKNEERAVEARLAEEGTRVIFQVDMLKKKISYILEEQEHIIKEVKDKMRQEFENKLIQDEVALKKANKRFYEYKEGMSFDIRRFIEAEKNQTLKAIIDKKNQTFSIPTAENTQGNFEIREVENGPLVSKLYELLKKTRALYQFKEVVMREKCQNQIDQIKKKAFGNQNLLHKVNDLQNSEATLKDELTEARKELAILERRNKVLRKALQNDSNEKIRLYREHSAARSDAVDMQNKYVDALKTKAIFIKTDKSRDTPSSSSKYYLKSHKSTLHSIKSPQDSIEVVEDNTTAYINLQDMNQESGIVGNVFIQENNESLEVRNTMKNRPSTASVFKSLKETLSTSAIKSPNAASQERNKSIQKNSSYFELVGSPTRQISVADGVKIIRKRRNKTEDQSFLMKKFIPPK